MNLPTVKYALKTKQMTIIFSIFLCRIMIFLSSVAATLVFFDHSGDIIHINISTSVEVEPTNAACAPSTATSDHWCMVKVYG